MEIDNDNSWSRTATANVFVAQNKVDELLENDPMWSAMRSMGSNKMQESDTRSA